MWENENLLKDPEKWIFTYLQPKAFKTLTPILWSLMHFPDFSKTVWGLSRDRFLHQSWGSGSYKDGCCLHWGKWRVGLAGVVDGWTGSCHGPWSLPAYSCWVCQEGKALTAVYPGHFSGLCLQQATLKDEVTSPPDNEQACLQFTITAVDSPSSGLPSCNASPLEPLCTGNSPFPHLLWDLEGNGNQAKHEAHAICCA